MPWPIVFKLVFFSNLRIGHARLCIIVPISDHCLLMFYFIMHVHNILLCFFYSIASSSSGLSMSPYAVLPFHSHERILQLLLYCVDSNLYGNSINIAKYFFFELVAPFDHVVVAALLIQTFILPTEQ